MGNVGVVFRREMTAYFTGPVGYVFLSAFLLFANLLALFVVQRFFDYPVADLRPYFHVLAGVGSFLVAAVTMRLWSEERKENTYELLLTLPLRARDLVLGKFGAALAFYAVGLLLTLPVPFMMAALSRGGTGAGAFGLLDPGAALSGYLGALLCGGLFVAFGLFVSGLCRDQVVAFVLTAPALFFAYILGVPWVQQAMNQALEAIGSGAGAQLGRVVGVFRHYDNLARGLVDLGDVLFFVVWTALFLFLNALAIERRGRPGAGGRLALATALVFAIGACGNWLLGESSLWRLDATADRVFTVSPVTERVLGRLADKLRVRYHVSPREKLPEEMRRMERDLRDKLDSLRLAAGGKLEYEIVVRHDLEREGGAVDDPSEAAEPAAGEGTGTAEATELRDALLRRIEPFPVSVSGQDRETLQLVYSSLELVYEGADKEPEIIAAVVPAGAGGGAGGEGTEVSQVEYQIANYVNRLTRARPPLVALVAPLKETDPRLAQMFMQMGRQPPPPDDPFAHLAGILEAWEGYTVRRVRLAAGDTIPPEADALVVVAPEKLNPRQKYEIARALASGVPTLLAAQNSRYEYGVTLDGYNGTRIDLDPNLDGLLPPGVALSEGMLLGDRDHTFPVRAAVPTALGRMTYPFPPWPMHVVLAGDSLAHGDPLFERVTQLRWLWGNALEIDEDELLAAGLRVRTLARANPGSELRAPRLTLNNAFLSPPEASGESRPVLAAWLEGEFPFPATERPAWPAPENPYGPPAAPPEEEEEAPLVPAPGKLLLMAGAYQWSREGLDLAPPYPELSFFLNAVGSLALSAEDLDLRALRDKHETRRFIPALTAAQKTRWKTAQVAGPVALLVVVGLIVRTRRQLRRDRYEREVNG